MCAFAAAAVKRACCWLWTKLGCLAEPLCLKVAPAAPDCLLALLLCLSFAAPDTRPPAALKRLVPRQVGNLVEGEFKHRWAAGRH